MSDALQYERVIYVSHPFQDKLSNLRSVENIILGLKKYYPHYLFLSPIHAFSFEYSVTDYKSGLAKCLWLLDQCDECWVYGNWGHSP